MSHEKGASPIFQLSIIKDDFIKRSEFWGLVMVRYTEPYIESQNASLTEEGVLMSGRPPLSGKTKSGTEVGLQRMLE